MSAFLSALKIPAHLKISLAFVRKCEHNTVMDSRVARVELKEQIMKTYEIFRADINKSILTIAAPDAATAFGAWASAAMLSGFIPFNGGYEYIGDERFSVRPVKAKHFVAEVREK